LQAVVSRNVRKQDPVELRSALFTKKDVPQLSKAPPLPGMVPLWLARLITTSTQLRWRNPPQLKEGTMPLFHRSISPYYGTRLRERLRMLFSQ